MIDTTRHIDMAIEIGTLLGRGKKVDLAKMADEHLTKECLRCEGCGEIQLDYGLGTSADKGDGPWVECPKCDGTGRVPA